MKIVVTGANGILGRKTAFYYELMGHNVIRVDIISDEKTVNVDFTIKDDVQKFTDSCDCDIWVHCIGSYSNNFEKDLALNVVTSYNLLESLSGQKKDNRIILIGSSAEYGIPDGETISENDPLKPINPYGLTKKMQNDLFSFFLDKGMDIQLLRIFNLWDPDLPQSLFIGKVYSELRKLRNGTQKKINIGYIDSYRDYIKTDDVARYIYLASLYGSRGEIYNVGTGKAVQIRKIIEEILIDEGFEFNDISELVEYQKEPEKKEVEKIAANISKVSKLFDNKEG